MKRGVRNNNPGNLRVGNDWRGEVALVEKRDRQFEEFESLEMGYRALLIVLRTYITRHRLRTIEAMIGRFAPPTENDTEAYIRNVSAWSMIHRNKELSAHDKSSLCRLAYAISRQECGDYVGRLQQVHRAWELI